jgi:hypothetical protein
MSPRATPSGLMMPSVFSIVTSLVRKNTVVHEISMPK